MGYEIEHELKDFERSLAEVDTVSGKATICKYVMNGEEALMDTLKKHEKHKEIKAYKIAIKLFEKNIKRLEPKNIEDAMCKIASRESRYTGFINIPKKEILDYVKDHLNSGKEKHIM